jgi:hypothetical protein
MRYVPWGLWLFSSWIIWVGFITVDRGSAFFVAYGGAIAVILSSLATLRLDKVSGQLTLSKYSLFGTQTIKYPLNQIADVGVVGFKSPRRVVIAIKGGKRLWLHPFSAMFSYPSERERCAEQILDFLEVERILKLDIQYGKFLIKLRNFPQNKEYQKWRVAIRNNENKTILANFLPTQSQAEQWAKSFIDGLGEGK